MSTGTVMWKMRRVRLDRIGPAAARFLDVTLDFTDDAGYPLDTILWLRNGGGKSTVLSLICALIRPHRRDFLATAATGKHLEDYVLGADTAHVVVEWSGPSGRRLVTGAVYEWADRTQPADPNRDHDRLGARWYVFSPAEGRAELDLLPFTTDGRPTPMREFVAAVRAWDAIPGCGVAVTDGQDRWSRLLDDHGLDPAIFTAILQMNATEGGIEGQFQFSGADKFVRYLLELIVDPEVSGQVSAILERVRSGLAERPELLADLTFADEAAPLLRELAQARGEHTRAAEAAAVQERAAAALATELTAAAEQAEQDVRTSGEVVEAQTARAAQEAAAAAAATTRETGLRRLAAQYRLAAARAEGDRLRAEQERAGARLAAWNAVPALQALRAARHRVASLEEQLTAVTAEAEPLRRRRDETAVTYAVALDAAIAEADERIARLVADAEAERAGEDAARTRWQQASQERGRLSGSLTTLTGTLSDLDTDIATAAAAGHLAAGEDIEAAIERHEATDQEAADALDELRADRARLQERRSELAAAADELDAERRTVEQRRRDDLVRLRGLTERIDELAGDERLRALAGGADIDPVAEAGDLVEALTVAIARAERQRIELAVDGAEDERSLAALATTGLLPGTLDLVRAHDALERAGIPAATGWSYLAHAVPPDRHAAVLQAAPALAAGLLIYDPQDLPAARRVLTDAALRPTSAVVLATTADLDRVVTAAGVDGETPFLVPPAPALTDRTAAGAEITARERARAGRAATDAELAGAHDQDADRRRRLQQLRADCPPGTVEALTASIATTDQQLTELAGELARVAAEHAALADRETALEVRRTELEGSRRAAAAAQGVLSGLLIRARNAAPQRTLAAALPGQIADCAAAMDREAGAEAEHRRRAEAAVEQTAALRRTVAAQRHERAALPAAAPGHASGVLPLAAARRAWETADQAYRREVSESALAVSLEEAKRAVEGPSAQVEGLSAPVREAAGALLDTPDAADPETRALATARAEAEASRLAEAIGEATAETREARRELDRHPAGTDDDAEPEAAPPATREEALLAAEGAEQTHREHLARRDEAEHAARTARERQAAARERATGMRHLVELLGVPADDTSGTAGDPRTVDEAHEAVAGMKARLDAASAETRRHARAVDEIARRIVLWAAADRFAGVKPEVRDRFRITDVAAELGPVADSLAADLDVFAANLRERLAELDEHKAVVVTAMTGMVRQALKSLARAQALSELPDTLGDWAGQRFLEVGPRASVETADAVVRDRCSRLVDALTARGVEVPRGQELLWQATSAVVGDGNWKARVLKPSTTFALERVSVERMRKWSGGEKVTISLLLFCMVAKLRATSRGRDLPGFGALPLDNPLGKANYVVFLNLQRKVAAANGVQLIFLTGVGDMKAVGRFPNIIRLRNTANRNREYVRVADRTLAGDDPAGVVDITRVWRDDPVLTLL
ncbi:hypothetical protein [Pseudonocardia acidicola]|uniref:Chromosome segregation ATPase n=1 Tax=Pseudonocardia acidicola TaxID=2724939 RepID=A0ABX1S5Y9_9PSEU|nr:hypothetical protein [Pseudonocardia acidicola]NMH96996.1 hypothetical protein [Pseudonocardia acidicola]